MSAHLDVAAAATVQRKRRVDKDILSCACFTGPGMGMQWRVCNGWHADRPFASIGMPDLK